MVEAAKARDAGIAIVAGTDSPMDNSTDSAAGMGHTVPKVLITEAANIAIQMAIIAGQAASIDRR